MWQKVCFCNFKLWMLHETGELMVFGRNCKTKALCQTGTGHGSAGLSLLTIPAPGRVCQVCWNQHLVRMLRLFIGVIKQPISLWHYWQLNEAEFSSNAFKYDAGIAKQVQFGDFFLVCYDKQFWKEYLSQGHLILLTFAIVYNFTWHSLNFHKGCLHAGLAFFSNSIFFVDLRTKFGLFIPIGKVSHPVLWVAYLALSERGLYPRITSQIWQSDETDRKSVV